MALTAVQVVNIILKRVQVIAGDADDITVFTDTGHLSDIDKVLQILNEVIDELYILGSLQGEQATGTITLSTGTREYDVPSDFQQMSGSTYELRVMVSPDEKNLLEYRGGREQMFRDQSDPSDFTGDVGFWVINPANNKFRVDQDVPALQNGIAYTFLYDKAISIAATADTFPFSDKVMTSLVPAIADLFRADTNEGARTPLWGLRSFRRAVALLRQKPPRKHYGVRRATHRFERGPLNE